MPFPDKQQQIIATHAAFIRQVVQFLGDHDHLGDLETLLTNAEQNGWQALSRAVRSIADGERNVVALGTLDDEDRVIAEAILRGLQDPSTLPDPGRNSDPAMAAPGLAHMIHAAASGNVQALTLISNMAEQMSRVGDDMGQLAGRIRPLINGERDPDRLTQGMGTRGEQLMLDLLDELGKLSHH